MGSRLRDDQATLYRALAARINYLSLDRADVAYAAQELCRDFAHPTNHTVEALKRLGRYLHHHPRLVYDYKFEDNTTTQDCFVDTDFAGCFKTRRSTSGGVVMMGSHQIKHYSSTQATVALSSCEAELVGIVKGGDGGTRFTVLRGGFKQIVEDQYPLRCFCRHRDLSTAGSVYNQTPRRRRPVDTGPAALS